MNISFGIKCVNKVVILKKDNRVVSLFDEPPPPQPTPINSENTVMPVLFNRRSFNENGSHHEASTSLLLIDPTSAFSVTDWLLRGKSKFVKVEAMVGYVHKVIAFLSVQWVFEGQTSGWK
jgi:hypothetical protein